MTTPTMLAIYRVQAKPRLPSSGQAPPNPARGEAPGELCRPQRRGRAGAAEQDDRSGVRQLRRGARGETGCPP